MNNLQQLIYDISRVLFWPVLVAALLCLVWVLIELGVLLYELWLRFRYRDLDALEIRALRARKAFRDGKPRTAYRYLQENNYSLVVVRFLYDLIRNYQTERLAAKPLKLLQEYEFYTIKRLERTRILVRLGPMLGLMGTLIPLSPRSSASPAATCRSCPTTWSRPSRSPSSASSSAASRSSSASSATACTPRTSRTWSTCWSCSRAPTCACAPVADSPRPACGTQRSRSSTRSRRRTPSAPWSSPSPRRRTSRCCRWPPGRADGGVESAVQTAPSAAAEKADTATAKDANAGLTFDDPSMDWSREEDPFANLGPVDPEGTDDPKPRGGGGPFRRR